MEEMDVLAATRNYLVQLLSLQQPDSFLRLLLYLFIREEDAYMTKVAYSGTAYYSIPTSPFMRDRIQDSTLLSFVGDNKTQYLLELTRHDVVGVDSVTLLSVGGDVVGVDAVTGDLLTITSPPVTEKSIQNNSAPNTEMSSTVSMTLYLCSIIVPLVVFAMIIIWWIARKLRFDVEWTKPRELDPENQVWHSSHRLERYFLGPGTSAASSREQSGNLKATQSRPVPIHIVTVQDSASVSALSLTIRPKKTTKQLQDSPVPRDHNSAEESMQFVTDDVMRRETRSLQKADYKPLKRTSQSASVAKESTARKSTLAKAAIGNISPAEDVVARKPSKDSRVSSKVKDSLIKGTASDVKTKIIEDPLGRNASKKRKAPKQPNDRNGDSTESESTRNSGTQAVEMTQSRRDKPLSATN
jgi:hypothetical protein